MFQFFQYVKVSTGNKRMKTSILISNHISSDFTNLNMYQKVIVWRIPLQQSLLRSAEIFHELPHPPSPSALMVLRVKSMGWSNIDMDCLSTVNPSTFNLSDGRFTNIKCFQTEILLGACPGQTDCLCHPGTSCALRGPDRISLWRNFPSKRFLMQIKLSNKWRWLVT